MKSKITRYINQCKNCKTEKISNHILSDMECDNCGTKTTLDGWEVREKEVQIKRKYIKHSYSVITNTLEVYVEMPFYLRSQFLFTINNPELRADFPIVEFPSQYQEKNIKKEINEWIFNNFSEVLKKLI